MYVPLFFTPSWDQSPEAWICTLDLQTLRITLMEMDRRVQSSLRGSSSSDRGVTIACESSGASRRRVHAVSPRQQTLVPWLVHTDEVSTPLKDRCSPRIRLYARRAERYSNHDPLMDPLLWGDRVNRTFKRNGKYRYALGLCAHTQQSHRSPGYIRPTPAHDSVCTCFMRTRGMAHMTSRINENSP